VRYVVTWGLEHRCSARSMPFGGGRNPVGPVPWCSPRRRTVPPLLLAGAVVGVQIAESILNPRQHMSDKRTLEVHLLVVTVCLVKYAAIADALNIAQRVVAVGTPGCCRLFGFVFRAHLGVVDAGEDVNALSAERILCKRVGLVNDFEAAWREHGGEGAMR